MITKSVQVRWMPDYQRWTVTVTESKLDDLVLVVFYRDESTDGWMTLDGRVAADDIAAFCDQAVNLLGDIPEGVLSS